jgi:hypothetical protein
MHGMFLATQELKMRKDKHRRSRVKPRLKLDRM